MQIRIFKTGQQVDVTQLLLVCVEGRCYLSLSDDVEGAALLSLPDDELSFIIVFLKDIGQQSDLKLFIDPAIDPGSR